MSFLLPTFILPHSKLHTMRAIRPQCAICTKSESILSKRISEKCEQISAGAHCSARRICRPKSRHGLDDKLEHGVQNSKILAYAVDLVCRSAQEGRHLSLECAERVSRSRFKEAEPSGGKVAKFPTRINEEAVLIYLLLTHCANLLPPALKKDSFAENLLPQVRDIASLQKLFSAYNRVLALLLTVGQQVGRPLLLKGDEVETSILWKPLDVETKKLIDRYADFH